MQRTLRVLLSIVALLSIARRADANSAAPFSRPTGAVPGVVVERASPVAVEREDLVIDCAKDESPFHPDCTFVATYVLRNPTAVEEELLGAFYTAEKPAEYGAKTPPPAVAIQFDGADAHAEAAPEQVARMDEIVRQDATIPPVLERHGLSLRRQAFRIRVAPGAKGTLVFSGTLDPFRYESSDSSYSGHTLNALYTRHPVFGPHHRASWQGSDDEFLYLVSPIRGWAGDPEVHVRIRHRTENDFVATSPVRFSAERDGKFTTETAVIRASARHNLRFRIAYPEPFIHNGGPLMGIGQGIGRAELRIRLGYEVGLSSFLILGAVADTNFKSFATTAVTLDAATPCLMLIIPSLSIGAGVPVQFREDSDTRVGIRTQLGASWPILGISVPIDIYPAENSWGSHVEAAFMVRASF